MKRFRLTPAAKILCLVLVLAIAVFAVFKSGIIENDLAPNHAASTNAVSTTTKNDSKPAAAKTDDDTINLSLDEWVGWKSLVDACGGLTTQPGSIFDQLGIKVNINIINDATQSSNALISGDLQAAGYTTNRVAFLSQKFKEAGKNVIMPFYTNYSYGGDGIIASTNFADISTWPNARIGVPSFSEAETLVAWFVQKSDLSAADQQKILDNLIMFDTPDDAAKAFFAGQIDVAATWEPYLSQAEESTNSVIVFDTTASSTLIMDGIVFDADWAAAHPDTVSKFIDGVLQAESLYKTDFDSIRKVMPMYSTADDTSIAADCDHAKLANWADNMDILTDTAPQTYNDMCTIWESLGETVDRDAVNSIFDTTYLEALADKYKSNTAVTNKVEVTQEQKTAAVDYSSMLTKSCTVNFVPDTAKFLDQAEAASTLNEFVEIAKTLDGAIIQIEGNINQVGEESEAGKQLSYSRAQTVANYLTSQGIDGSRIVVIGNGNTKMIGDPNTEEGKIANRRTDVMFKMIEN